MSNDEIDTEAVDRAYGFVTGLMDRERYQRDWAGFHQKAQAGINKAAAAWFANYQNK